MLCSQKVIHGVTGWQAAIKVPEDQGQIAINLGFQRKALILSFKASLRENERSFNLTTTLHSHSLSPEYSPGLHHFSMTAVYKSLTGSSTKSITTNGVPVKKNKQRVLILSSRGVTFRQRHLLNDLYALLPHSRKDAKLDTKTKLYQLNELADLYNCNNVLFFEARKGKDLYIWMSKAPNGPTVKCHMQNCTPHVH